MSELFNIKTSEESFELQFKNAEKTEGTLNGTPFQVDIQQSSDKSFHVLHNHNSYVVHVVNVDFDTKTVRLSINGKTVDYSVKDRMDLLLESMGIDATNSKKVNDLKAPMPGLVLDVLVKPGDRVKKGDPLLILEAMKMENMIKASGDGNIKKVLAIKGSAVEKNTLLIQFE